MTDMVRVSDLLRGLEIVLDKFDPIEHYPSMTTKTNDLHNQLTALESISGTIWKWQCDCGAKLVNEVTETRARMADIHDKLMDLRKALNRRSGSLLEKQITDAAICLTNVNVGASADEKTLTKKSNV